MISSDMSSKRRMDRRTDVYPSSVNIKIQLILITVSVCPESRYSVFVVARQSLQQVCVNFFIAVSQLGHFTMDYN